MAHPDVHKTLIPTNIVSAVGDGGPHRQTREVIGVHLSRFTLGTPRLPRILKITDPLFLLGVDRKDRVSLVDEISDPRIDRTKLFIPVGGSAALFVFGVPLKRVVQGHQLPMHRPLAHRMPLVGQSSAMRYVDLLVQRKGLMGSPAVVSSMIFSKARSEEHTSELQSRP